MYLRSAFSRSLLSSSRDVFCTTRVAGSTLLQDHQNLQSSRSVRCPERQHRYSTRSLGKKAPVTADRGEKSTKRSSFEEQMETGPNLRDFLQGHVSSGTVDGHLSSTSINEDSHLTDPIYLKEGVSLLKEGRENGDEAVGGGLPGAGLTYFTETYGCQMNVSDTEILNAILKKAGASK